MRGVVRIAFIVVVTSSAASCRRPPPDPAAMRHEAASSIDALRTGNFAAAHAAATDALGRDDRNSTAAAVRALTTYQRAGSRFRAELIAAFDAAEGRGFDHARMREIWERFGRDLDAVDGDLAIANRDPGFALELCPACWSHDWNHSGEVDDRDRKLFQVERDANGNELPPDDPRRTPTFRFDIGDVHWARAMIGFQRAAVEIVLAYKWNDLDRLIRGDLFDIPRSLRIRLDDARRVHRARDLILFGLDQSDRSRAAYLAETDDDREWVPNPRQRDHPVVSLPVDDQLYQTWQDVVRDVRALVRGREGLSVSQIAQAGKDTWRDPPTGFIDIGKLLDDPQDIVIDLQAIARLDRDDGAGATKILRQLFGGAYVAEKPESPLVGRILTMKSEIDRDESTFDTKLGYFLWIN